MICGCSLRISSATESASIHFRLSMPAVVAALQDAVDQRAGLVVAQRLGQHRADVPIGAPTPIEVCCSASCVELAQHLLHLVAR